MKTWSLILLALATLGAGCGSPPRGSSSGSSDGGSSSAGPGGAGGAGGAGMGGAGTGGSGGGAMVAVPDPGNMPANDWPDVEPNNTPDKATAVGVISGAWWLGFSNPASAISSPTDIDFYVFKTPNPVGIFTDLQVCWSFNGNLLDLSLYEVVNGFQGAAVASSAETDPAKKCEVLLTMADANTTLKPDSTYLLEVRAAPNLMLGADPGAYDA